MQLQAFLARAGCSSRRGGETLILEGRVKVNGVIVRQLGTRVDPQSDRISFDGRTLTLPAPICVVLHKPPNTVCTTADPEGRETVLDLVRMPGIRLYPVGRLDYNTTGVLLLTNDGELAQHLAHPSHQVERIYHVKVQGLLSEDDLEPLRTGVILDPRDSGAPKKTTGRSRRTLRKERVSAKTTMLASTGRHTWLEMTLTQGLNHQIHRMIAAIGRRVLRIIRVEFAGVRADNVRPAQYRILTAPEYAGLRASCGLPGSDIAGAARSLSRKQVRSKADRQKKTQQTPPDSKRRDTAAKQEAKPRRSPAAKSSRTKESTRASSGQRKKSPVRGQTRRNAQIRTERESTRKQAAPAKRRDNSDKETTVKTRRNARRSARSGPMRSRLARTKT